MTVEGVGVLIADWVAVLLIVLAAVLGYWLGGRR